MKFQFLRNNGLRKAIPAYSNYIKKMLLNIIITMESFLPLNKTIVLECESDLDDNPRAIYEFMLKENLNQEYRIVWIVKDVYHCRKLYKENNVFFVSRFDMTIKNQIILNYYLSTSKWFVFSHPYWFKKKRKNQFVLNVWHGVGMKAFKKESIDISDAFDWALVPSKFSRDFLSPEWPKNKFIIKEYPRLDLFLYGNKMKLAKDFFFDYSNNSKLIMSMPTYRQTKNSEDGSTVDKYSLGVIENEEELIRLNDFLVNNNIYIIVKIHPLQNTAFVQQHSFSNIRYITNQELLKKRITLYELLGCCDALLTDVSSVYTDFLVLNRPVGFFMDNFNIYERGYIVNNPLDYMPGDKIYDCEDLYSFIKKLGSNEDLYNDDRQRVNRMLHDCTNESNSKKVFEWMVKR